MDRDGCLFGLAVAAMCAVAFFACLAFALGVQYVKCVNQWEAYNPTYSVFKGCRVEVNGKLTPTSALREIDI